MSQRSAYLEIRKYQAGVHALTQPTSSEAECKFSAHFKAMQPRSLQRPSHCELESPVMGNRLPACHVGLCQGEIVHGQKWRLFETRSSPRIEVGVASPPIETLHTVGRRLAPC